MGCVVPSQGAWKADLKAISGASTELPSRIIQKNVGKPWRSYTAGIDAVIVDHQNLTRHRLCTVAQESKHRGYGAGGHGGGI